MIKKLTLITIVLLAFVLRFWKLDSYPALNADEATIGYNAYSLLQTGEDEHGNSWPIHFQSFNDYKPGLYFYLVLPFVKILGLNEWAVRIPGALLGVATIYLMYLLVMELFDKNKLQATIAAFMLAISPWHIHFSRGGWEVNVSTFFIVAGVYLFIKGRKNLSVLMLSVLSFALALYTYHAARVVVPLVALGLLTVYREDLKIGWKNFVLAGLVGVVCMLPLVKDFTKPEVSSRAAGVGLFADPGPLARINEQRGEHGEFTNLEAKLLHNKAVNYGLAFLENWSEHYHGLFLFLSGDDIQRDKIPETGQMYLYDILFLGVGLLALLKSGKISSSTKFFVGIWVVVAPVASAFTFQSPHALRSHNMVIPLTIVSALGLSQLVKWFAGQRKNIGRIGILALVVFISWQFCRYEHMYWVHMAKEYPFSSQYGVKELVSYLDYKNKDYDRVLVTDRYDQPYILFLFYLKYPPAQFQKNHILSARDKYGFSTVGDFDKFEFRPISWDNDQPSMPNTLIVGVDEDIPDEANIVKKIYGSNGYKYFEVVAN